MFFPPVTSTVRIRYQCLQVLCRQESPLVAAKLQQLRGRLFSTLRYLLLAGYAAMAGAQAAYPSKPNRMIIP